MRKLVAGAAGTPDARAPGVTLRIPTHMAAPSHALAPREGPKPTRPRGASRAVETQAELAELAKLTSARVTPIMNLLSLAPDIQEEIFFLPPVPRGGRR